MKYLVIRPGNSFSDYDEEELAASYTFEAATPEEAALASQVDLFTNCLGVEADGMAIKCIEDSRPETDEWLVKDSADNVWSCILVSYPISINILSKRDKPSISWSHAVAGIENLGPWK